MASTRAYRPSCSPSYAYLLGMYLGDGCITVRRTGGTDLRVRLDARYPGIVELCAESISRVLPACAVKVRPSRVERSVEVAAASAAWTELFPQHGKGAKHTRPIVLEQWQRRIVSRHPRAFIRGLIHSDGCRTVNRFATRLPSGRVATYEYTRYFFSNLSPDIRELFCDACANVGVRCTQGAGRNVSVAHRDSTALLDRFVGAKY